LAGLSSNISKIFFNIMINRSVVIVRGKQPFANWLAMLPDPVTVSLEELNREPNAYLLPEYEEEAEREGIMRNYSLEIFEQQLYEWSRDESTWPAIMDYAAFKQWFQLEFAPFVIDLGGEISMLSDDEDE
jgi:hypothetical protein